MNAIKCYTSCKGENARVAICYYKNSYTKNCDRCSLNAAENVSVI